MKLLNKYRLNLLKECRTQVTISGEEFESIVIEYGKEKKIDVVE